MPPVVVPTPPRSFKGTAAPSPARKIVQPIAFVPRAGEEATRRLEGANDGAGSPRVSTRSGSVSPTARTTVKWSKLPSLMRKMKVVNDLQKGSSIVGANVEWGNAVETADRLSSRIQTLREKSNALGFQLDPRLLEQVFQTADGLADFTPMSSSRKKKDAQEEKDVKKLAGAKARAKARANLPTDLPLNMLPQTYLQLPKRVQRRLAREYASRDQSESKSIVQKVAAAAATKAAHAKVIEPRVGVIPSPAEHGSTASVMECLLPLMELSRSKFTATLRDLAAALHSLALNDENRMAFFVTPGAMEMLYRLAHSSDEDILRNITGTLYRLSMGEAPGMKRTLVAGTKHHRGIVQPLLQLARGSDRGARQYAMGALKELCECPANRSDMLDQGMLQLVFEQLSSPDYIDIRVRRDAVYSLSAMAEDPSNREKMVEMGCLPRLLGILRNPRIRDSQMRRAASRTLERLAMTRSDQVMGLMTSKWVLMTVIAALSENSDCGVIENALRTLQILGAWSNRSRQLIVKYDAFDTLFRMAQAMLKDEEANGEALMLFQEVVRTIGKLAKGRDSLEHIFTIPSSVKTTLNLCKFPDKTVRRAGASLLTKLSTLEDSKMRLCKEKGAVHLMLQMAKLSDNFIQFTAAQCLAELAEEPRNRRELLGHGVLPVFTSLARTGDPQTAFECARGLADLSEACDNRIIIVYTALRDILDMLRGDEDDVQENAARCLCNLLAPAGEVATAAYGEEIVTAVGRYGALKEDDDSETETETESEESEYEYETVDENEDADQASSLDDDSTTDDDEPPDWFLGKVEMPSLEDTDPEMVGAACLIQDRWRAVQARRLRELKRRMKMAVKIQSMWRLTKQREQQAKEEEEARLAAEEAEAEWEDVVMAKAELEAAEKSGDQARITKAKANLAREIAEAEEAQVNAEREHAEAEAAKAAAKEAEAEAAAARKAHAGALAKGRPRRPRPVTPPRKPGQRVLSAKTRRAISGKPAPSSRSKRAKSPRSPRSHMASPTAASGEAPAPEPGAAVLSGWSRRVCLALTPCAFEMSVEMQVPEDVAIQQKLAGRRGALGAALFGSDDDQAVRQMQQELENQPDWWQSEDGKSCPRRGFLWFSALV